LPCNANTNTSEQPASTAHFKHPSANLQLPGIVVCMYLDLTPTARNKKRGQCVQIHVIQLACVWCKLSHLQSIALHDGGLLAYQTTFLFPFPFTISNKRSHMPIVRLKLTWWRFTQTQTLGFRSKRARPVAERMADGGLTGRRSPPSHIPIVTHRFFFFFRWFCFRLCLIIFSVVMASSRGRRRSEDSHRPQHLR
jgi:hypothetical protein